VLVQKMTDLSGTLENGLWGYHELPGLDGVVPRFSIEAAATIEKNAFFSSRIEMSTITGLYLESQAHIIEGGKTLDCYGPERFLTPAKLVKLPPQLPRAQIDGDMLQAYAPQVSRGDALLICTGWGARWNTPGYVLECPNLKRSALEWVISRAPGLLGVDIPCIESSWSEDDSASKGSLLREMFARDMLLLAPLVNLENVEGNHGTLVCLPLKLKQASGAPCRAVFIEVTAR
jgi:arylformamidase